VPGSAGAGEAKFQQRPREAGEFDLYFYALRKDGEHGGASLWSRVDHEGTLRPARYVVNDDGTSRAVEAAHLLEKR
jgi:hypothetical protein